MNRFAKTIIKYITGFVVTAALLTAILCLAAKIPTQAIYKHTLESAKYLSAGESFGYVIEKKKSTMIDRYSDAILLNIAWNYDTGYPLRSTMLSAYYFNPDHDEPENLLLSVSDGLEANQQYMRYWHGSIAIVRPLLMIMPIRGIYILNAVILLLLFLAVVILLIRMRQTVPALGITLGIVMTAWWFVPLSLEYTWTCSLSLAATLAVICISRKDRTAGYELFFMITGMVTIFLDFLTTETLTLLFPLLTLLWLGKDKFDTVKTALTSVFTWGVGYTLMWITKWLLASLVFNENVIPYVKSHIEERIGGKVIGFTPFQYMLEAVRFNISHIFPLEYGYIGIIAFVLLISLAIYLVVRFHQNGYDKLFVVTVSLSGLIPFVRYLVLHNHSYRHSFFTYRALASTILAIVMIIGEITEITSLTREKKQK